MDVEILQMRIAQLEADIARIAASIGPDTPASTSQLLTREQARLAEMQALLAAYL